MIVKAVSVRDIVLTRSINFITRNILSAGIPRLFLVVEHLAIHDGPRQKIAVAVKRCEESVFLTPDHVLVFLAHTDASHGIQVWERDHNDIIVALYEREAVAKRAPRYEVALSAYSAG